MVHVQDEEASGDELIPNWEELFNKVLATCSPKLAGNSAENSEPVEAPAEEVTYLRLIAFGITQL